MSTHKKKANQRNERHGAAWGGGRSLLLVLILVLAANSSFAQRIRAVQDDGGLVVSGKLSPDLAQVLQAGSNGPMRVIVQYRKAPGAMQVGRAQARGAKLHSKL
ncbi:MAG: hypothetical protein HYR57_02715, partial [Candidatus Koribacter versatilis]|nr:hypothetical protein [Candidatus Koribacter versatilis]